MASIRSKLTWRYTLALLGTLLLFSAAILVVRRSSVMREMTATSEVYANLSVQILREASTASENVIVTSDSLVGPVLNSRWQERLDVLPAYIIVLDRSDRRVYQSAMVRALPAGDLATLDDALASLERSSSTVFSTSDDEVVLVRRSDPDPRYSRFRVVAGLGRSTAEPATMELLGAMALMLPLLIGISVVASYVISGEAVEPFEVIRTEVEAITDGRSLHRRLPVEAGGDEISGLTHTLNDMIGRLETSFGALRRFTADASHELKTPLAVLRADVERAMHAPPNGNEQLVALEEALQETTRMADLVDSLLTLARADEGRLDLHREPIDLDPLVREVFETAVILGEGGALNVQMPVLQGSTVLGDRTRLRQLFLNLITNAIKYTPKGGDVEVSLSREPDFAVFSVRDTGIGIAAAELPYVFERFWRADRVRSRAAERGGFGLGLSISQWIAQAHGGTLTVQSRLNRGSTFTVTIPYAPVADGDVDGMGPEAVEKASAS
ncbi:MAG: Adaptive-response sensory-kinase SasA [Gemmatimonadaceae bacterium]|nr:Adaptive-response sensory-kinase SasA [Gemmatimonadaceae bacterium]